ncbi:target of Nesh-SH3 isoform X5 [Phyllopteryx taeniolatus]|uniref:target of Nesh-SH3 isoform X5 n=1 Tax=Phyllopteryx taeniolatus TaxID=161469 RepID=UPI002AD55080|nr:target of Nesh-SH3 isoform X5 [Phyllopteryx taeniolatus]
MTRTQQRSPSFLVLFLVVLVAGIVLSGPSTPRRSRVRRQNMKVRINATGDTIVMKFVRPNADTKLEGYILGYGSSMFSKQFIPLPENGKPYETEFDAEPKYLIAVQPIPTNDVKKHCTGKVELEKPLHLVIGSVTPTSVLLSWGTLLKTPYEGNIMNDCLEDGHYTVRYRERNRKWNYQTCPTSDTVIDNLKPNAVYEFGVQPSSKDKTGSWSKPVIHNISSGGVQEKVIRKIFKRPMSPVKPQAQGPHFPFTPRHVLPNRTQGRLPLSGHITPKTTLAPTTTTRQEPLSTPGPATPATTKQPIGGGLSKSVISPIYEVPLVPNLQLPLQITAPTSSVSVPKQNGGQSQSHPPLPLNLHQPPTQSKPRPQQPQTGTTNRRVETPRPPTSSSAIPAGRNTTFSRIKPPPQSPRNGVRSFSTSSHSSRISGAHHRSNALPKPGAWSKEKPVLRQSVPVNKRPNLVGMPNDHDKPMDLKQGDKESILKPFPLVTSKPKQDRRQQTATTTPSLNSSRFDINENSSIFRPLPASDVDIMGKKRYVAPHVIYKTDKKPDEPCSITSSLAYFPDDEDGGDQNVTAAPRIPPSNLTVVTVEGCPSFVILDWQKSDNETREYEVVSTAKGPNGEEVSILTTTNQTHTAVENLKPESSYEFKVTPKNELGTGPSSEPVSFNTESADPRVSENVSGKDAIWTQFPFKTDAYSECNGKQYVKRTWYRKFVGIQLCNSLRYKIYLSDSLNGKFYNIGDQSGHGEDHCQFVDSFLDGRTGTQLFADQLPSRPGYLRALRQEPVSFGEIGGKSHVTYVGWYECGTPIPGKW